MFTALSHGFTPVLADSGIYISGGVITLLLVVVIVLVIADVL